MPAATACKYMVFRFSNVYGRYDNDIERMERVIPLSSAASRATSRSPSTARTRCSISPTWTIASTGIMRRASRRWPRAGENQTINLAYGQGNTLVRMAELIGAALGRAAHHPGPAAAGRSHPLRRRHIQKAHDLLGYTRRCPWKKASPARSPGRENGPRRIRPTGPAICSRPLPTPGDADGSTAAGLGYKYPLERVPLYPPAGSPEDADG